MGSVHTSLGEWIHSPWVDLGLVVWKGYRPRVRLVLAGGHASAWFSPFWRGPAPGAQRYQAVHNQLLQHGFQTAWLGRLRVTTTSSAAGATARIAVIVQTGCGFLSGGRRGASADDREDCYGRATMALTRAIQHTYVVSPLDMSGMIGMAQTLAVYHYGYYTLKAGQIYSHESAIVPSDAAAVLE